MKLWQILGLVLFVSGCTTVTHNTQPKVESNDIEKAESRITLGLGYLENGNMVKALENLERASSHAPYYYRTMLSMAHYYDKVGETHKAHQAYQDALDEHDDNGHVLNNYGAFLCKVGEYSKADRYFNQATEAKQYYLVSASYENAGLCALKYRNLYKARQYFIKAVEHDPQRVRSLLQLTRLEIDAGDFSKARIRLAKFHRDYGYQQTSLKLLVDLEKRAGNLAMAQKYHAMLSAQ